MSTDYKLEYGSHRSREDGMCLLEAVAWLAGEPHTDHPACVCPVLAAFGRALNDAMGEGAEGDALRAEYLADLAPRLVGTRSTREIERARAFVLSDHAVRVFAPLALQAVGLNKQAARLRALEPVTDTPSANAARAAARAAANAAANAARAAADADAARAAAYADAAAYANAYATAYATAYAAARAARAAADAARVAGPDLWVAARAAFVAALEVAG